MKMILQILKTN